MDVRALKAIEGHWRHKTNDAYQAAWAKLDKRFGRPEIIVEAYEEQLNSWPTIKSGEGDKLEDFIDFLESVAGCVSSDLDLNSKAANKQLILKLPHYIAQRWANEATKLEKRYGKFPPLADFIEFLSDECDVIKNPLTKTIQNSQKEKSINNKKKEIDHGKKPDKKGNYVLGKGNKRLQ